MENKLVSPTIERSYRHRYFVGSPSTSPHSENSSTKIPSMSTPNKSYFQRPYSFLSKFEKEIFLACKKTNSEIKEIKEKADVFMTEIDERIDFLKANPPTPKPPFDYIPLKPRKQTQKKSVVPPPKSLSVMARTRKELERKNSIEELLKTSNNFNTKSRDEIIIKLQKSLGAIRSPCIEGLYADISRKEHSFEVYKKMRHPEEPDPFTAFNQVCINEHIPPIPLLRHIHENTLALNRYRINDSIALALSDSVPLMPYLIKLHLDENAITDTGISEILKALTEQGKITSFYYTNNEIGKKFSLVCKDFLQICALTEINLRGCKVLGTCIIDLIVSLKLCKSLRKLYLSELGLSDVCMEKLGIYMKRSKISELDLSWNQISQDASLKFFKVLRTNKHLTMLDYSWNSLGSEEGNACIILNYVLIQHPNLMHINLSYTQLNDGNFLSLSPGLQNSRTLVCAHFTGNNISQKRINTVMIHLIASNKIGYISDSSSHVAHPSEGVFMKTHTSGSTLHNVKFRDRLGRSVHSHRDTLANISHSSKYHDRLSGKGTKEVIFSRYLGDSNIKELKNWGVSEHCWICERWIPFHIKVNSQYLDTICSINDFKWNTQVLAPVKLKCSFNLWEDIPMEGTDINKYEYAGVLPPGNHKFWIIINNTEVCVSRQISRRKWETTTVNEMNVEIRNYDLEPIIEIKEPKNSFDKNKSVFKNFTEDTPQTRKIMFSNDKKHLKLPRIIKDEASLNEVYNVLLENFAVIKEIFDATSAASNYPNIGWLDFSNFCERCQLIDNRFLNRSAIDRCFIAVNVDFDDLDDNPQQELCRYEFFEIIVRMAMFKYQDLKMTVAEMTAKLIQEHIFKYSDPSQAVKFRREKLYNSEVNSVLEANLSQCQILFAKHKERLGRWISLEGYKKMVSNAGINLKEENIIKVYAFSKMSILDEMANGDSYDRLVFVEFLETLGRLSNEIFNEVEISLDEKISKTLGILFAKSGLRLNLPEVQVDEGSDSLD